MRLKVVAVILLLGSGVLGIAVFLSRPLHPAPGDKTQVKLPVAQAAPDLLPARISSAPTPPTAPASVVNPSATHPRTVEELQSLAMNHDADSLKAILAELTNSDPEIRAAAREAAVQFGDRAAAPPLRAVAAQTENVEEKRALLEAADFLELPPLEVPSVTN